jgi:hypothetical protein
MHCIGLKNLDFETTTFHAGFRINSHQCFLIPRSLLQFIVRLGPRSGEDPCHIIFRAFVDVVAMPNQEPLQV